MATGGPPINQVMRRLLAISLAMTVLMTGAAYAATPKDGSFAAPEGKIVRGYDLSFKVSKGGKQITKVVAHVLETCDGSSTSSTTTVGPALSWAVKGGRFSGRKKETYDGVTVYTTFEGKFTSASTAVGTIRQESIVAGSVCDTYKLKFTAKRSS
jgi:hypothetical protein